MSEAPLSTEAAIAVLLERTKNIQADVQEVKDLQKIANGRVSTLESQMLEIKIYRRIATAIAGASGGAVGIASTLLTSWFKGN